MYLRLFLLCLPSLVLACATASNSSDSGPTPKTDATTGIDATTEVADADTLVHPDADTCPGDPCQIAPQCGCGGQACDLDFEDLPNGSTACRDITVPGDESASCNSTTACAAGFVCLSKQCRAYCNSEVPCSGGGQCLVQPAYDSGGGVLESVPGVTTCTKSCSPEKATDNGCPSTPQFGCHLVNHDPDGVADNGDEFYHTDCRSAPSTGGGNGDPCLGGDSDCRAGYECVSRSGNLVCKQLCIYPDGSCDSGTCVPLLTRVFIDGIEYAVCL